MTLIIAQIGDIHIESMSDKIFSRCKQLANCIASQCDAQTSKVLFLLSGDYTQRGNKDEFRLAEQFIGSLVADVQEKTKVDSSVLSVPGNHDLNLEGDQTARDKAIRGLSEEEAKSPSIQAQILSPLSNYFDFANKIHGEATVDWRASPFFNRVSVQVENKTIQVQLFNSAWMSQRRERPDSLYFPIDTFSKQDSELSPYVISVIHHPMNWFRQPDMMRQLRTRIEESSDFVVTGHEHSNDHYGKIREKGLFVVDYLEGGVLQERSDESISTFNILKFNFQSDQFCLQRFQFGDGIYQPLDDDECSESIPVNRASKNSLFTPSPQFAEFLRTTDLPIQNAEARLLSHQDIFTFPDLRERNDTKAEKPWIRISGEVASREIRDGGHCLLASDAMGGKTSLAKQLCLDSLADNRIAVFLKCEEGSKVGNTQEATKWISKQVDEQYGKNSFLRLVQQDISETLVVIDDLHLLRRDKNQVEHLLNAAMKNFSTVCATVDTEFLFEESRRVGGGSSTVTSFRRLQLCEFGHVKIEDLARRWLNAWEPGEIEETSVRRVCKTIERVLRINAMAHHPWVLIVLLQEANSGTELAAKNGSYGFLYQAVITCALAKSRMKLDIKSKYTYIAGLAMAMYERRVATFDLTEAKAYHNEHYQKYRVRIDFDTLLSDFENIGILRSTGSQISFKDKYSYWFFVSWYLSENIHNDKHLADVKRLCSELHHEDSANILVFLSHFSNHPTIIRTLLETARSQLNECEPSLLDTNQDLQVLNLVGAEEMRLILPTTTPDENHRILLEQKDIAQGDRDPAEKDGRAVSPSAPEPVEDEFARAITTIRASIRSIDILGQVLRNGVGDIPFDRKSEIVREVYSLARRLNAFVISDLPSDLPKWSEALNARFHELHVGDSIAKRLTRISNHIVGTLSFLSYALARRVSHALAHEDLEEVFDEIVSLDDSNPSRLYDLSARLDLLNGIPVNKLVTFFEQSNGNVIVRNALRSLVANYLYLHRVDYRIHQEICSRLHIEYSSDQIRTSTKKTRSIPAPQKPKISSRKNKSRR